MTSRVITCPIFYLNAKPHIGHLYTLCLADTQNRYYQLKYDQNKSKNLLHIGTDEHGQKISEAAKVAKLKPKKLVDKLSKDFIKLGKKYDIRNDDFIRTTEKRHLENVSDIWSKMLSKGDISLETYSGWYCASDENFVQERDTELSSSGETRHLLNEPHKPVNWMDEENYVFNLEKYISDPIFQQYLEQNVFPNAGKKLAFQNLDLLLKNLESSNSSKLSISRPTSRLDWAIKVPDDNSQGIYVWLDALSNYLTTAPINTYQSQLHIIGKDIIKFHAIYWPAFLLSLDVDIFKHKVLVHGHWTVNDLKMSKSLGNVLDPLNSEICKLVDETDTWRWFLLKGGNGMGNSSFRNDLLVEDIFKDFSGGIGTLVNRMVSKKSNLLEKWPELDEVDFNNKEIEEYVNQQSTNFKLFDQNSESYQWDKSIRNLNDIISLQHKVLADKKLHSMSDNILRNSWHAILYETMRCFTICCSPVLPNLSGWLFNRYKVPETEACRSYESVWFLEELTSSSSFTSNPYFYPKELRGLKVKGKSKSNFYKRIDMDKVLTAKIN